MYKVAYSEKMVPPDGESSTLQLPSNVATFLAKLWVIVNDPKTNNLIRWSAGGKSFIIKDQARFARELLPHYYKHNNMTSFVRQLNMYGFHKKVSVELGGLKCDKDDMEFEHEYFCKGHASQLSQIKRKIASNKNQDTQISYKPEFMNKVLTEIRSMQGRQEKFDNRLIEMKTENDTLWRELMILRQKHMQQQKIVNKLIHFLVTLVQSRGSGLPVKRRLYQPLMIDNSNRPRKKTKLSEPQVSPTGPVIHELDASEPGLDSEYIVDGMLENEDPDVQSPESTDDYSAMEVPVGNDNKESIHLMTDPAYMDEDEIEMPGPSEAYEIEMPDSLETYKIEMPGPSEVDKIKPGPSEVDKIRMLSPSEVDKIRLSNPLEMRKKILEADAKRKNLDKETEEFHLLDIPFTEGSPVTVTLNNGQYIGSKPVPMSTVRSSKLAAMAATMKKSQQDVEPETETSIGIDDDNSDVDSSSIVKLEHILNVQNMPSINDMRNNLKITTACRPNKATKKSSRIYGGKSILKSNNNLKWHEENAAVKTSDEDKPMSNVNPADLNKDLSLSCVNSSGASEANYRLDSSKKELTNYLENMEGDLDNIRELLHREGFIIDAQTLLELFGNNTESMSSYVPDLSLNPQLNQELNCDKEEDHVQIPETMGGLNRGELMTYNSSNLFDFDEVFPTSSSLLLPDETTNVTADPMFDTDPLNFEENKPSFFDNFHKKDMNSRS